MERKSESILIFTGSAEPQVILPRYNLKIVDNTVEEVTPPVSPVTPSSTPSTPSTTLKLVISDSEDSSPERENCGYVPRSIKGELAKIQIPENVRIKANEIFLDMKLVGNRRDNKKKQLYAKCIYEAYKQLSIPVEISFIAEILGLTVSKVKKAFSLYSPSQTGVSSMNIKSTPQSFLSLYCEKANFTGEAKRSVTELADSIFVKCPSLLERSPQSVAGGILAYYLSIHGVITAAKIETIVGLSTATILPMKDLIARIDNK